MDSETVVINGEIFKFVKRSRRGEVAVYTSGELYARVGEKSVIENMLALHQKFDGFGFPVAKIMGVGENDPAAYFLEESFGDKCFSFLFKDDFEKQGRVSEELFEKLISVAEKFARAQLRSAISEQVGDSFAKLVGPNDLHEELPEFSEKISTRYHEAVSTLKVFPSVLTHGDFNPHNLFPGGVIDFEETYYGPAGYDLVTNIFSNSYFPETPGYGWIRLYSLTPEQKNLYYTRLDKVYTEAGLPKISEYREHFEFLRAIWLVRGNHQAPKLQAWRYDLFKKAYFQ